MVSAFVLSLLLTQSDVPILDRLKAEATALESFVETPLAKTFLNAVPSLPSPSKRTVFQDTDSKKYFAEQSGDGKRKPVVLNEKFYYDTKYGTPLAYARAIDLLGNAGLTSLRGKKFLDFGYGGIGPLRLIAENGGTAVGLDVDSLLKALYSKPLDTGRINGRGRIELVEGFFPTDASTVKQLEGDSPRHKVVIQSSFNLRHGLDLMLTYRYVSAVPDQKVEAYSTGDVSFGFRFARDWRISLVGRNLMQPYHFEYGGDPGPLVGIKRAGYLKLTWSR